MKKVKIGSPSFVLATSHNFRGSRRPCRRAILRFILFEAMDAPCCTSPPQQAVGVLWTCSLMLVFLRRPVTVEEKVRMTFRRTRPHVIRLGRACERSIYFICLQIFYFVNFLVERFRFPDRWNWQSCKLFPSQFGRQSNKFSGGVPSPLDEAAEQATIMLKEQAKLAKQHQASTQKREKEAVTSAAAAANVAVSQSSSRHTGLANSDADRALRLAAVESRLGVIRCIECNVIINGPTFDQMGFRYCSTACVSRHRKSLPL